MGQKGKVKKESTKQNEKKKGIDFLVSLKRY